MTACTVRLAERYGSAWTGRARNTGHRPEPTPVSRKGRGQFPTNPAGGLLIPRLRVMRDPRITGGSPQGGDGSDLQTPSLGVRGPLGDRTTIPLFLLPRQRAKGMTRHDETQRLAADPRFAAWVAGT